MVLVSNCDTRASILNPMATNRLLETLHILLFTSDGKKGPQTPPLKRCRDNFQTRKQFAIG